MTNKPEKSRIEGIDESACGQQSFWPGDARLMPGNDEKTTLPTMLNSGKLYDDKDATAR